MARKQKSTWTYGVDPNPGDWHSAADVLRKLNPKKKSELPHRTGNSVDSSKDHKQGNSNG